MIKRFKEVSGLYIKIYGQDRLAFAMSDTSSLANVHEYDARSFGTGSHEKALLLGLDILRDT